MSGKNQVIQVQIRRILPTRAGCAVFLGNEEKTFVIYVDPFVGSAIAMQMSDVKRDRPQTHDLIGSMLNAFGSTIERVVINDFRDSVFFARMILQLTNEVQEKMIIELDARPSDSIVLALQAKCPLYVAVSVWDAMEYMSEILSKIEDKESDFETGEWSGD